jgi:hypothetical protein
LGSGAVHPRHKNKSVPRMRHAELVDDALF